MRYFSHGSRDTRRLGCCLGRSLQPPALVLLEGQLGSGKTVLTQGLAEGLGISSELMVHSPTFSLVNEYPTCRGTLFHLDLYRLDTQRDLESIGIDEILAAHAIVAIEWADKLIGSVPGAIRVRIIQGANPSEREIQVEGLEFELSDDLARSDSSLRDPN